MNELQQLRQDLDALTRLVKTHTHIVSDQTQALPSQVNTYAGKVDTTATSDVVPKGWTVTKSAGHVYTVTHNLNNSSYSVVAKAWGSNSVTYFVPFLAFHANTFTVEFDEATGSTAGATDWTFILTVIS